MDETKDGAFVIPFSNETLSFASFTKFPILKFALHLQDLLLLALKA